MSLINFQDFFRYADFFYTTLGIKPYEEPWLTSSRTSLIQHGIFYVTGINISLSTALISTFAYLAFKNGDNFVEGIVALSYVGFEIVCITKMFFIRFKRGKLNRLILELCHMFPKSSQEQVVYQARKYLQQCLNVTFAFSLLYMILIWIYNLSAFAEWLILNCLLKTHSVEKFLPYTMYIPWNYQNHWSFYLIYSLQCLAGYTAAAGQMASDLMLCSMITQVIMHYDNLGRKLKTYNLHVDISDNFINNYEKQQQNNLSFLKVMIAYHVNILSLTDLMNDVFGIPLLINFMTSCSVICFVGFQLTIGEIAWDEKFRLLLFLFSSIAQVYLICHYGQRLIEASTDISRAVYEHDWSNSDVRYQKMLTLLMQRAQKPALLQATYFVDITREKFSELMNTSYTFFTLLSAMYGD